MRLICPPLISKKEIRQKVLELAREINKSIQVENLHAIIVLKGALFFASDLLRELPPIASMDFIRAESYRGCNSVGEVKIPSENLPDVKGKQVLLIEDIFDTGLTTQRIIECLRERNPETIHLCVLLEKRKPREGINISSDFVGFYIDDNFVVGYGMDYNGRFRNLPDIYILDIS